jgi:hypothetical protein
VLLSQRIIVMGAKGVSQIRCTVMALTAESSQCLGNVIHFRCPAILPTAVKRAADQKMISASAYMRQAIADQLKRDGVALNPHEAA